MLSLLFILARASISCDIETVGANQIATNGDKLVADCYIDKKRTTMCKHGFCTEKQLEIIKWKIKSKFGSNLASFIAKLDDGDVVSFTGIFCEFGSGKEHES